MGFWEAVVPLASVVVTGGVTGGVAIWSKRIDASTKRDDRQHEVATEAQKRVGQETKDALYTVISATLHVRRRAQLTGAANSDEQHRRAVAIRALHDFRDRLGGDDGIAQIWAYTAEPVRQAVDDMLDEVDAQRRQHLLALMRLQQLAPLIESSKGLLEPGPNPVGPAMTSLENMSRLTELTRLESEALNAIGTQSDLDVDELIRLCDKVISSARDEIHGQL